MLAHNAYHDHGKYSDRLDRAIASGPPFVVEEDMAWIDGESLPRRPTTSSKSRPSM
jgi:hypothetical protein